MAGKVNLSLGSTLRIYLISVTNSLLKCAGISLYSPAKMFFYIYYYYLYLLFVNGCLKLHKIYKIHPSDHTSAGKEYVSFFVIISGDWKEGL